MGARRARRGRGPFLEQARGRRRRRYTSNVSRRFRYSGPEHKGVGRRDRRGAVGHGPLIAGLPTEGREACRTSPAEDRGRLAAATGWGLLPRRSRRTRGPQLGRGVGTRARARRSGTGEATIDHHQAGWAPQTKPARGAGWEKLPGFRPAAARTAAKRVPGHSAHRTTGRGSAENALEVRGGEKVASVGASLFRGAAGRSGHWRKRGARGVSPPSWPARP